MAKIRIIPEIIDKETAKQQEVLQAICKECGKEALCGRGFCRDCKAKMKKTLFPQT